MIRRLLQHRQRGRVFAWGMAVCLSASSVLWANRAVGFDLLTAFTVDLPASSRIPEGHVDKQIPSSVKELNGQKISMRGFMLPIEMEDEKVRHFLLLRDNDSCCFGGAPPINGYVEVTSATGKPFDFFWGMPIDVSGTFTVGEKREEGMLMSIYQLSAESARFAK